MGPYRYLRDAKRNLCDILAVYLEGYPTLAGLMSLYSIRSIRPEKEPDRDYVRHWVEELPVEVGVEQIAEFYLITGETPGAYGSKEEAEMVAVWLAERMERVRA